MSLLEREGEHRAPRAFVESLDERSFDSRAEGFYSDGQPFGGHVVSECVGERPREQRVELFDEVGDDRGAARPVRS